MMLELQEIASLVRGVPTNPTAIYELCSRLRRMREPLEVTSTILSIINSKNPAAVIKKLLSIFTSWGINYMVAKKGITVLTTGPLGRVLSLVEITLKSYGFTRLAWAVEITNRVLLIAALGGGPFLTVITSIAAGAAAHLIINWVQEKLSKWLASILKFDYDFDSPAMDTAEIFVMIPLIAIDFPSPPPSPPPPPPLLPPSPPPPPQHKSIHEERMRDSGHEERMRDVGSLERDTVATSASSIFIVGAGVILAGGIYFAAPSIMASLAIFIATNAPQVAKNAP
jgi:hypothetical protein